MASGPPSKRQRLQHPYSEPVVSTIDRAAKVFDLDPTRLAQAVQVPVWGRDYRGDPVFRWRPLVEAAQTLGAKPLPKPKRWNGALTPILYDP